MRPRIRLTDAAAATLRRMLLETPEPSLATILWVESGSRVDSDGRIALSGPRWAVAFYARSQVPSESACLIDHIPFVIEPAFVARLDGAVVDYVGGAFEILPAVV